MQPDPGPGSNLCSPGFGLNFGLHKKLPIHIIIRSLQNQQSNLIPSYQTKEKKILFSVRQPGKGKASPKAQPGSGIGLRPMLNPRGIPLN